MTIWPRYLPGCGPRSGPPGRVGVGDRSGACQSSFGGFAFRSLPSLRVFCDSPFPSCELPGDRTIRVPAGPHALLIYIGTPGENRHGSSVAWDPLIMFEAKRITTRSAPM